MSCKSILNRLLYQKAITQAEHDKLMRNLAIEPKTSAELVNDSQGFSQGDLISRADAQKITAKVLSGYITDDVREVVEAIDAEIGELPSAQPEQRGMAEVVRCKDCKNYYISTNWCDCHLSVMKSDDFCSYGTRMDGEL